MKQRLLLLAALFGLVLLPSAQANVIASSSAGYSFDFPEGWALDKGKRAFTVMHADGSSFEAMAGEGPPPGMALQTVALMQQLTALAAGFCDHEPATEFELSGKGWSGRGFHCNNQPSAKSPRSQTIGFTVQKGKAFHQFLLIVPRQDWRTSGKQYRALLGSLRFRS